MPQRISSPPAPFFERLRSDAGRRTAAFTLVLLIEGLLLLMLFSFGAGKMPGAEEKSLTVLDFTAEPVADAAPEESRAEAEPRAQEAPQPPAAEAPQPAAPAEAPPVPVAEPVPPTPLPAVQLRPMPDIPRAAPRPAQPAAPSRPVYGPRDPGRPAHLRDTERVGTAPNGEPLYAAAWYQEPREEALGAYLSGARGPGWGLIACRTAPGYRVEDCVGLAEYPEGSQIMRAVLAAAWEFKVRPPRRGGKSLVGSWVRIRIDYGIDRR